MLLLLENGGGDGGAAGVGSSVGSSSEGEAVPGLNSSGQCSPKAV